MLRKLRRTFLSKKNHRIFWLIQLNSLKFIQIEPNFGVNRKSETKNFIDNITTNIFHISFIVNQLNPVGLTELTFICAGTSSWNWLNSGPVIISIKNNKRGTAFRRFHSCDCGCYSIDWMHLSWMNRVGRPIIIDYIDISNQLNTIPSFSTFFMHNIWIQLIIQSLKLIHSIQVQFDHQIPRSFQHFYA